jgi:hypothetical protein
MTVTDKTKTETKQGVRFVRTAVPIVRRPGERAVVRPAETRG